MQEEPTLPSDEPAWYCVRTKTKQEYLAAKSLAELGNVQSFCPRLRYRKATKRGKVWWVEAMFPGYIFAFFSRRASERDIVHARGVMKLLKFGNDAPEVPATFIADLLQQMQNQDQIEDDMLTLHPTVSKGDEVEVAHGALQGFQGQVVDVLPALERVKILVEFLGNDHLVEIDLFSLILQNKPIP